MLRLSLVLALCVPSVATAQGGGDAVLLPANSEVPLVLDQEVSSKRTKVGDAFDVSVARDVWIGGQLAIPRGARGRGVVVWKTGKGAFGKSGKLEIELRSVQVGEQLVPLTGKFRQEGSGNTAATVGTIVAAGVIAGMFVTGHSAVFAQGTELRGYTATPVVAGGTIAATRPQFAMATTPAVASVMPVAAPSIVAAATIAVVEAPAAVAPQRAAYAPASMRTSLPVAASPVVLSSASVSAPKTFTAPASIAVAPQRTGYAPVPTLPRAAVPIAYAVVTEDRAGDRADEFARLLRVQQGVRGREVRQGWTISD